MTQGNMQRIVEEAAKQNDRELADRLVDAQTRILTSAYSSAMAYTNLIILAAYAGFFGLWKLSEPYISGDLARTSALCMTLSVTVFVLFEVWKMYYSSRNLLQLNRIITDPELQKDGSKLLKKLNEFNTQERSRALVFGYVWHFCLFATVLTGLVAVGTLMGAFVHGLWTSN